MPNKHHYVSETDLSLLLDWRDRPESVKQAIAQAYENLGKLSSSTWTFNGDKSTYDLMDIDEYALLKSMILSAYPEQKIFNVLDVGAGNFTVNSKLLEKLQSDNSIPTDVWVHLIGVRAEGLSDDSEEINTRKTAGFFRHAEPTKSFRVKTAGHFTQYDIGQFQIENMIPEFERLRREGFPIELSTAQIDLCLSRFTLIHLVDPLGTFLQIYELLKPGKGRLLSDGFYFSLPDEDDPRLPGKSDNYLLESGFFNYEIKANMNLYWLLNVLHIPFLMNGISQSGSLNQFIIQKPNQKPLWAPLSYTGLKRHPTYLSRTPNVMASFRKLSHDMTINDVYVQLNNNVTGSAELFNELKKDVFNTRPSYGQEKRCYPLDMVFDRDNSTQDKRELMALPLSRLRGDLYVSVRPKKVKGFLSKNRHLSDDFQHEYDKRYGIRPR